MKKALFLAALVFCLPFLAAAQDFSTLLGDVTGWVRTLTGIVAALALLVFFWGLVKYIWSAGNEDAKSEGKRIMIWGVIALFVMFSLFGIIGFFQETFNLENAPDSLKPPSIDFPNNNGGNL